MAIKPKYEVHKREGESPRRIAKPAKNGGFDYEDVMEPNGWMVYFPNGSSVHIRTEEALIDQGFHVPAPLIDMETGDEVPNQQPASLRSRSEQLNNKSKGGFNTDALV